MPKKLPFTDKEVGFLRDLVKNKIPFLVVGLSAAALQGAPVVTQDVDLWFKDLGSPKLKKILSRRGAFYIPPFGNQPPKIMGKGLEFFDLVVAVHGLESFEKEARRALDVSFGRFQVKVLPLERIIQSKETLGREKDKAVLPILRDVLLTLRASTKQKRSLKSGKQTKERRKKK